MPETKRELIDGIAAMIPRLRRYARFLSSDVDQADMMVGDRLTRALAMVEARELQIVSELPTLLFRMLRQVLLESGGKRKKERRHRPEPASSTALPLRQNGQFVFSAVERTFLLLPIDFREILLLVTVEGLSYEQVSDIIGVSVETVKSRLARARDELDALLGSSDSRFGAD